MIDDGNDYYGTTVTKDTKIYGQKQVDLHVFYGVVREIDLNKNSIYEG